jgi:hypothetical protein
VKYGVEVGPTAGGHCVEAAYRNGDGIGRRAVRCIDIHTQSKPGVVIKLVRDNRELISNANFVRQKFALIPWKWL